MRPRFGEAGGQPASSRSPRRPRRHALRLPQRHLVRLCIKLRRDVLDQFTPAVEAAAAAQPTRQTNRRWLPPPERRPAQDHSGSRPEPCTSTEPRLTACIRPGRAGGRPAAQVICGNPSSECCRPTTRRCAQRRLRHSTDQTRTAPSTSTSDRSVPKARKQLDRDDIRCPFSSCRRRWKPPPSAG